MDLRLNLAYANHYKSPSQKIRVMTEGWAKDNAYCPACGNGRLVQFKNNKPVADFYCPSCLHEFELKSKSGCMGNKINDGAYDSMIQRITSKKAPSFIFLNYSKEDFVVKNLIAIPSHYFTPDCIEKRKPLSSQSQRAGWVGCNILLNKIPSSGVLTLVQNNTPRSKIEVMQQWRQTAFIKEKNLHTKRWLIEVMRCLDAIPKAIFSLSDIYAFEQILQEKFPDNNFIKEKIRQQLQILRDKGVLDFLSRGVYQKNAIKDIS